MHHMAQDFTAGKVEGFEGQRPTKEDWMQHVNQSYPEV